MLSFIYVGRRLPSPDPRRTLGGSLGRPRWLAVIAALFFVLAFTPILRFFAFPFIPISTLYVWLWRVDTTGILATVYPMVLAGVAVAFFTRYSLSADQILGILGGALFIPWCQPSPPSTCRRGHRLRLSST